MMVIIMFFKDAVSERIIQLCEERDITINKLSEMSVVPTSTLRDMVSGKVNNPSATVIYQVCKPLNIKIKDFFNSELFDDLDE